MGKASRWFRSLLGLQNSDPDCDRIHKPPSKKRWRFPKSNRDKDRHRSRPAVAPGAGDDGDDFSKHGIAVAAATAAVAEAAVAAAHAAAVVVRLTNSCRIISTAGIDGAAWAQSPVSGRGARYGSREEWAAVTVQSHFRAYLSRRALRALKALVRLQALVRGHLVRKQTAYALRQLQALVRAQARALAGRALYYDSPQSSIKSLHFNYLGPPTPDKSECVAIRARSMNHEPSTMLKRNTSKSKTRTSENPSLQTDHDKSDKVLEVDSWNTTASSRKQAHFLSGLSPSSCEAQSSSPLRLWQQNPDESAFCTAENSPTFHSATSSKKGAFSNYSNFPSYMACTESSRAKARSVSAPKQRPEYERSSSTKRYSIHGFGDLRSAPRVCGLHAGFTSKAYPGSGRLDRLGIPVTSDVRLSGGDNWYRS